MIRLIVSTEDGKCVEFLAENTVWADALKSWIVQNGVIADGVESHPTEKEIDYATT